MIARHALFLFSLILTSTGFAQAGELAGTWTAEFDTQIGVQKYTYEFTHEGDTVTGKATYAHSMGQGTVALSEIKTSGDDVSFSEVLSFDGNELRITYKGKLVGDEMKLTRQVADIATEQVVARRAPATPAIPSALTAPTNLTGS